MLMVSCSTMFIGVRRIPGRRWKGEAVAMCYVILNECVKQKVISFCSLVIPKVEGFLHVRFPVFIRDVGQGPVGSIFDEWLELWPVGVEVQNWF